MPMPPRALRIAVEAAGLEVSALLERPADADMLLVLAHGAGADMHHAFMQGLAQGFAQHRVATLRYQFPYSERGKRQVDRPSTAHATVRAAVRCAVEQASGLAIFAGGKSFGGRMTSQAQAIEPLPQVQGLVFFGFPLHPAWRAKRDAADAVDPAGPTDEPSTTRADHLADVKAPMLFVQGTKDALARFDLIEDVVRKLGDRATLHTIDGADHGFSRLKGGAGDAAREAMAAFVAPVAAWMRARRDNA